jgi:hypothetical protein
MDVPLAALTGETSMKCIRGLAAALVLAASCATTRAQVTNGQRQEPGMQGNAQENPWHNLVDVRQADTVPVVLRVRLLRHEGGDKIAWDKVALVGVIKNASHYNFPREFEIARYVGEPGVPGGESTVYLERYNPDSESLWRLLGGSGKTGVSHAGEGGSK